MLVILTPVWIALATMVLALLTAYFVKRVVIHSRRLTSIVMMISVIFLFLFLTEVVLIEMIGAVRVHEFLGPLFFPLNTLLCWVAAAALGSILLLKSGVFARWWPIIGVFVGVITISLSFYRVGVRDIVKVDQGRVETVVTAEQNDGPEAYLFAPSFSSNVISVFDLKTNSLVKIISLGSKGACCIYPLKGGEKAYVVSGLDPYVSVMDLNKLEIVKRIRIEDVWGEAGSQIQSDGRLFWVGEIGKGYVEGIDTKTDEVVHAYVGGGGTMQVSPNGIYLYTLAIGGKTEKFTTREADTGKLVGELELPIEKGVIPSSIFINADGSKAYLTLFSSLGGIMVIDLSDPTAPKYVNTVRTGAVTLVGTFSPDGSSFWVPNAGDGTISIIDSKTDDIIHTIELNRYVSAVDFAGDYAYIAQSSSIRKPTYARSAVQTALGVVLGGLFAPVGGSPEWRPGIEPPAEIVVYNRHTYKKIPFAPMSIPSTTFTMAIVEK